jgi:hypothetical protein
VILEWDVPFELITPQGTLLFNQQQYVGTTPLGYFNLDPSRCSAGAGRRITRTNLAQKDGEIVHRKFKSGYVVELNCQLWEQSGAQGVPACGGVLREMGDLLDLHLNAIENADGRLEWSPSEWPVGTTPPVDRMLDDVRALGPSGQGSESFVSVAVEKDPEGPLTVVTFALLTPLPYVMDAPETTTVITAGGTLTNGGNADFYPVVKVHGPTNTFTITNTSVTDEVGNPLEIHYDAGLPGANSILSGHYAELDLFRNTVYLDGNSTNLKAGIDVLNSDFFPLAPGANVLTVGGGYTGSRSSGRTRMREG